MLFDVVLFDLWFGEFWFVVSDFEGCLRGWWFGVMLVWLVL